MVREEYAAKIMDYTREYARMVETINGQKDEISQLKAQLQHYKYKEDDK